MRYKFSFVYIYIIIIFCNLIIKVKNDTINILIQKPDIEEEEKYLEYYNKVINQYFLFHNDTFNKNKYEFKISYCENYDDEIDYKNDKFDTVHLDADYGLYLNCIFNKIQIGLYDMMIVDDNILFSNSNEIENYVINRLIDPYENSIKVSNVSTDKEIYNNNFFEKNEEFKVYEHPYEIDFDVLYYYNNYDNLKNFISNSILNENNIPPSSQLIPNSYVNFNNSINENMNLDNILSIGLANYNELFNLFIEFIINHYGNLNNNNNNDNFDNNNNNNIFDILYKNKDISEKFYIAFKNYIESYTGSNLNKTLETTIEEAYKSFISKNKVLFKGKASYYKYIKNNTDLQITLQSLPNDYSIVQKKYIVINMDSMNNISLEDLNNIASHLTSKEMQLYRAEYFGSIPIMDISKKDIDHDIADYCQLNPDICSIIQNMKPISVLEEFKKGDFISSLSEARLSLPVSLKNSLIHDDYSMIKNNFRILKESNNSTLEFYLHLYFKIPYSYFIVVIVMLVILFIIMMTYKKRDHPYMKPISPNLCNLLNIGLLIDLSLIFFSNNNNSVVRSSNDLLYYILNSIS
eukprot:jgi/Orpsp1_1/1175323/evm.model.c7180000053410.1